MARKKRLEAQGAESDWRGAVGQKRFALWASEAGVICNPATEDRGGWDFFLDLPPAGPSSPPLNCKVQVKTVGPSGASVPISLSNWRRMVHECVPWFIVIIAVDDAETVRSVHLLPVEGAVIERAVKALTSQSTVSLNTRVMTVRMSRCRAVDQVTVFNEIRTAIGDQMMHVQKKLETLRLAQEKSPETRGQVIFQFSSRDEFMRQTAEFAVGLRPSLPFQRLKFAERFLGLPGRKVDHDKGGTFELPTIPSMGLSTVVISNRLRATRIARAFNTHSSQQVFPFIPEEETIIRLTSPLVSITFKPSTQNVSFNIKLSDLGPRVSAKTLGEAAEFFLELCAISTAGNELEIQFPKGDKPMRLTRVANIVPNFSEDLTTSLAAFRDAWRVLRRLGLEGEEVELDQLAGRPSHIRTIATTLAGEPAGLGPSFEVSDARNFIADLRDAALLFVAGFPTASRVVLAPAAIIGRPEHVAGRRVRLMSPRVEIVFTEVVPRAGVDAAVRSVWQRAAEMLRARNLQVVPGPRSG